MDRITIITAYEGAQQLAAKGHLDPVRVDRALAIALGTAPTKYKASPVHCTCPDAWNRHITCKHMIAALLVEAGISAS